jgi:hypothetical protein
VQPLEEGGQLSNFARRLEEFLCSHPKCLIFICGSGRKRMHMAKQNGWKRLMKGRETGMEWNSPAKQHRAHSDHSSISSMKKTNKKTVLFRAAKFYK